MAFRKFGREWHGTPVAYHVSGLVTCAGLAILAGTVTSMRRRMHDQIVLYDAVNFMFVTVIVGILVAGILVMIWKIFRWRGLSYTAIAVMAVVIVYNAMIFLNEGSGYNRF